MIIPLNYTSDSMSIYPSMSVYLDQHKRKDVLLCGAVPKPASLFYCEKCRIKMASKYGQARHHEFHSDEFPSRTALFRVSFANFPIFAQKTVPIY